MVMTGHFGNWELLSHVYGAVVAPAAFIVKPLRSPILDAIVTERRQWAATPSSARRIPPGR
jgi:lauroyl/myristoyl acyltransferase